MKFRTAVLAFAVGFACNSAWAQSPALKLDRVIELPDVEGRMDHLSVDASGGRIFVAALGNGTVEIADISRGQRVGRIKDLNEPQGLLYLASNQELYVATGGDGMVRAYNARSLALVGSISLGDDADNVRFDLQRQRVLIGYGDGAIASLSPDLRGKIEVRLPVHPESFQLSADGESLFCNLPNDRSLARIDMRRMAIAATWSGLEAQANFPMAVNPSGRFIFIASRAPAELLELDESTGSVLQRIATVGDADDLFFDNARHRIYVTGGEGFVDVVDVATDGKLSSVAHVPTAPGARTGLFVPAWGKLIVAAPHRGNDSARLLVYALP